MTDLTVDFVSKKRYGYNGCALERRTFTGPNFFDACRQCADFLKEGKYGLVWIDVVPQFIMLDSEILDVAVCGDGDIWRVQPVFLEAIRSFL